MSNPKPIAIAAACAIFVASVAAATADEDSGAPPAAGAAQITAIEPEAKQAMEVLEEGRTSADVMRNGTGEVLDERAEFGANPDLSRLAIGNATRAVYVVPARQRVCIAFTAGEQYTLTCPDTDDVASGKAGPLTVGLDGGAAAAVGIVPDGVESVTVHTDSGSITAEVQDNAYYVSAPAGSTLETVSYSAPIGPVTLQLVDPRHAFDEGGS